MQTNDQINELAYSLYLNSVDAAGSEPAYPSFKEMPASIRLFWRNAVKVQKKPVRTALKADVVVDNSLPYTCCNPPNINTPFDYVHTVNPTTGENMIDEECDESCCALPSDKPPYLLRVFFWFVVLAGTVILSVVVFTLALVALPILPWFALHTDDECKKKPRQ